jgi:ABC-type uncharacterized transport system permease subunit
VLRLPIDVDTYSLCMSSYTPSFVYSAVFVGEITQTKRTVESMREKFPLLLASTSFSLSPRLQYSV